MLSDKEKEFARELLDLIDLKDLITLTDTVTNRAVSAENREGKAYYATIKWDGVFHGFLVVFVVFLF